MAADIMSAVDIAAEFRDELARLDAAAVDVMLGQWRQVEAALIADMEAFAARFEAGETLTPGQVLRMQRYQALQAQVTAQLSALEGAAGPLITAGQNQAAGLGVLQAAQTLDALEVGISFNQLSTKATQNIVALARAGKPLSDLLAPMYGAASDGIIRELINGVALGYGPRKIARNMARDGMTDALNHLLLVSRDQYNRAARTAAFQRYEDSGVVRGYTRRCARQVGRTCPACIALDGEFYPLSVPFAEHPQGRCVPIPAIKGVEVRSRLGSGKQWFEGLSEEEQIATMGRGRWEAWKAGELPWDKMAVKTNHPVWGPGVRVANVPDGFKKAATRRAMKWQPVMSQKNAEAWAAQGVYPKTLYHVTDKRNVDSIMAKGFIVDRENVAFGRTWGHGVYMFTDLDEFAQAYIDDMGDKGHLFDIKANIKNPLLIDLKNLKVAGVKKQMAEGLIHPQWNEAYTKYSDTFMQWEGKVAQTAQDLGFDSLIITGYEAQMIVFDPKKLVIIAEG